MEETEKDQDRVVLRFSIRDTGIGLTEAQMSELFEPFSQGDSSTDRKFGGTGLGLSICQRLVEMMGGRIRVESQPGLGSTFSFTIVCRRSFSKNVSSVAPPAELEGIVATHFKTHPETGLTAPIKEVQALVVEDNEINQAVAADLLENINIKVTVARDGRRGITALKKGHFDLVLMDIEMPVMDGYAATREIRDDPRFADIPIIAMTAHAMSGTHEMAIQAGMNDLITKPIDPRHLYSVLSKWLNTTHVTRVPIASTMVQEARTTSSPDPPGFDVGSSLKRLRGDRTLYRDLLTWFSERHCDAAEEIQSALQEDRVEQARRLAHTLQGVAGNIGARDLQIAAGDLERALGREDQRAWREHLNLVRNSLEQALSSSARLRSDLEDALSHDTEMQDVFDSARLISLLAELKISLENSDGRAVKSAEFIRQYAKGSRIDMELEEVERLVKRYDYDAALEILATLEYGENGND